MSWTEEFGDWEIRKFEAEASQKQPTDRHILRRRDSQRVALVCYIKKKL